MPENHLPEVAGFQVFLSGRVWVFGDILVRMIDPRGKDEAGYVVTVDTVDAGFGDRILVVSGSLAAASALKDCPVDAAIVGVVDIEVKD